MNQATISSTPIKSASAAASAPPADGLAADAQSAVPFAFLLARQIGTTERQALDAALAAIAANGAAADGSTELPPPGAQDMAADAASLADQAAGMVAAILQQLPAAQATEQATEQSSDNPQALPFVLNAPGETDATQTTPALAQTASGRTLAGHDAMRVNERPQAAPAASATQISSALQQAAHGTYQEIAQHMPAASQTVAQAVQHPGDGQLSLDALKRSDLPQSLTQSAPSAAQTAAAPSAYAAMPGTLNSMAQSAVAPSVSTPVGQQGWADDFSQKVSWIATQQNQVAELRLNPPNLGPLDVVLKITDNQATAVFTSPHGAVREAVENAIPKLRELLADNGIMLGNTTVSDQTPRERNMDGSNGQGFATAAQAESGADAANVEGLLPAEQATSVRRHNGMVDTFA